MPELAKWDSFYVIAGSAAGTLIGLQFVMMTLIAGKPRTAAAEAGAAFATPTIVHFSVVLFLAALSRAPWQGIAIIAGVWGVMGLSGVVYALMIARRMRKQGAYRPQFEDWIYHAALPLIAYGILAVSSFTAVVHTREALFGVGGAALLLLLVGIHNAWDSIAWHVFVRLRETHDGKSGDETSRTEK
jgi:hypothetical protein